MRRHTLRSQMLLPGLILLALLLFLLPQRQVAGLRGLALSLTSPLLQLCPRPETVSGPHLLSVVTDPDAAQEVRGEPTLQQLNEKCDRLKAALVHLESENAMLRRALGGGPDRNLSPAVCATVIARKTLWQEDLFGLDRGENQGVHLNAPVLHRDAVVGRIVMAGPNASSMAPLTHRGMSVAARLSETRPDGAVQGILEGADEEDGEPRCKLKVVRKELAVKPGEHVVTCGLDGTFPAALWLGDVVSAKKVGALQWEVSVRPACDTNSIETVQILTGAAPEVPWPASPVKGRPPVKVKK